MVCQGHIYYIDSEWNGFVSYNPIELPLKYRKKALLDRKNRKIIHWAANQKPWRTPLVTGADEWWDVARQTPYYEHILYTNICAILRGEMNEKITEQANRLTELGKALTDLGTTLTGQPQPKHSPLTAESKVPAS